MLMITISSVPVRSVMSVFSFPISCMRWCFILFSMFSNKLESGAAEISVDEQNNKKEELVSAKIESEETTSDMILPFESNENENKPHIGTDKNNGKDNQQKESGPKEEQLDTVDMGRDESEEDKEEEENGETHLNKTASESSCETVNANNVQKEDTKLVCDDLGGKETADVPNKAISSGDKVWKCQWNLPCLTTKLHETATSLQITDTTNKESVGKDQIIQTELHKATVF